MNTAEPFPQLPFDAAPRHGRPGRFSRSHAIHSRLSYSRVGWDKSQQAFLRLSPASFADPTSRSAMRWVAGSEALAHGPESRLLQGHPLCY